MPPRAGTGASRFWARTWRSRGALAWILWPVSLIYCAVVIARRALYRAGLLRSVRLPVPVVVVGNLTVGGTGKTPLVAWLAGILREHGFRPGIVSRGYGGRAQAGCRPVAPDSDPADAGDEPVLLARTAGCPVVTGRDRVAAARLLLAGGGVDVVISDDGLQHLRMARDVEIVVIDGDRRFGNGLCLPAGPLREPRRGAAPGALQVCNGAPGPGEFAMQLAAQGFVPVRAATAQAPEPAPFPDATRVHAVAGIGNPERFFRQLESMGLVVDAHAYPDHYPYNSRDLEFGDSAPVVMTAKDAVKCREFAADNWWWLSVTVHADPALATTIIERLGGRRHGPKAT